MTELDLYKYINDNIIEWRKQDNNGTPDIIIFPRIWQIEGFAELFRSFTCSGGFEFSFVDGYFAIWMNDICDYYSIDPDNIFIE